jgi:protein-tyrosine phosphatase
VLARTWHEEEVDALADLAERAVPYLVARYLDLLDEAGPVLAAAIELIARPGSGPLLFHCAAGKDRTGMLAALLLRLLGVGEDDVVADYVLSADAMARRLAWLQATDPAAAVTMAGQPAGWLAAPAAVMQTVLRHLDELHGGPAGYLTDHGVDPTTLDDLRDQLLT